LAQPQETASHVICRDRGWGRLEDEHVGTGFPGEIVKQAPRSVVDRARRIAVPSPAAKCAAANPRCRD
jgi:hypothetical protein